MKRLGSSQLFWVWPCSLVFVLLAPRSSFSQSLGLKCQTIYQSKVLIKQDGVIDPATIEVSPDIPFSFDPYTYVLSLDSLEFQSHKSEIQVCYRALSFPVKKTYFHLSDALYDSTMVFKALPYISGRNSKKEELLYTPDIFKTGSLSRGVSFGSSQNVNVTSAFNFQMEGKLSDQLNIRADITDQKVPFQPEGNTAQLREFDHVGIEVYNDKLSLKAGDVMLENTDSYFLKYRKNVLGVNGSLALNKDSLLQSNTSISVGSAKGQFADLTLQAVEGLQGPYQFQGADGQRYFVILANSEKVYVDGELKSRGARNDYIIDYNLGELTFMPSVVIAQYSRIRVTFEYSDQSYSRSIVSASQQLELGNSSFNIAFYQEKDNKNRPVSFELTPSDQLQMSLAGDDNLPVPIVSKTVAPVSTQLVTYELDSVLNDEGGYQQVYVYSLDSLVTRYIVSFSDVGEGNGNYELSISDVNGRVYTWVEPLDGVPQGRYEPIQFVPAPSARSMVSMSAQHKWTPHISTSFALALSNQDDNLYSTIGNDDNSGLALKGGIQLDDLSVSILPKSKVSVSVDFEHDTKDFKAIDRFRSIEYDRNWGYSPILDSIGREENIMNASIEILQDQANLLELGFASRSKTDVISGYQQYGVLKKSVGDWRGQFEYSLMENEGVFEDNKWKKYQVGLEWHKLILIPGYKLIENRNEVYSATGNELSRTAMNFFSHEFYIKNSDSSKVHYQVNYSIREDQTVVDGELLPYLNSRTLTSSFTNTHARRHRLDLTFSYRDLSYQLPSAELDDEQLILGRLNWQGSLLKRAIRTDLSYSTSSSREILREFIFIEVASGEGTHTWRDLNQDGIQDLTEFFEAINFDERIYIKVYVPTTDFVNAFNTVFVFSINAGFPTAWAQELGVKKWLHRLSNRTSLNINKKNTNSDFDSRFNPFDLSLENEDLIFTRDAFRSIFFYNKSGKGFAFDFGYFSSHSKQLVSNGLDTRFSKELTLNNRMPMHKELMLKTLVMRSQNHNKSAYQEDRNFLIRSHEVIPSLVWQPKSNLRLQVDYRWVLKDGDDETELNQEAKIGSVILTGRWTKGGRNALNASFTWSEIEYDGDVNTAISYEMLEALLPGTNYSWQFNFNHKLLSGLQLNMSYDGRKSSSNQMIHMGRMQITALF